MRLGIKIYRSVIKLSHLLCATLLIELNKKIKKKLALGNTQSDVLNLWRRSVVFIIGLVCDQLQQIVKTMSTFPGNGYAVAMFVVTGQFGPLSCRSRQPVNFFVFAGSSMWRSSPSCW